MHNQLNFDRFGSESIDGFADKQAVVCEGDWLDLEVLAVGAVPDPSSRHQMVVLVPLDDGLRKPRDGAQQLDSVALLCHIPVQVVFCDLRWTWNKFHCYHKLK